MEIVLPRDHGEDIIGGINFKRRKVQSIDPGDDTQTISAFVPMAEALTYAAALTSMT
jgi:translation elongation factor EF-G